MQVAIPLDLAEVPNTRFLEYLLSLGAPHVNICICVRCVACIACVTINSLPGSQEVARRLYCTNIDAVKEAPICLSRFVSS